MGSRFFLLRTYADVRSNVDGFYGISKVDLVLIHHPAKTDAENQALWKGMEQAVAMNLTRSIGLSNFNQEQIESLLKIATIKPALNQCK